MFLINEEAAEFRFLEEANTKGGKDLYIEGIFLQGGIKNKNGRMYPVEVLENEVERYVTEKVKAKRAFGELGHPDGPGINLDRISHIITELKRDGKNFLGKAKISSTPSGDIVRNLINDGAQLGVSSRGMGSMKIVNGIQEVQKDFKLATAADIVVDPSAPDAYINGIMEGVDWWYDLASKSWKTNEIVAEQVEEIHKMTLEQIDGAKAGMINRFIRSLV